MMTPEPVSSNCRARAVFLGACGLLRDDVNHRRGDGLRHQLERPIDVLKLFVLLRQDVINRVVGVASGEPSRQSGGDAGGCCQLARPVPAT